MATSNYFIHLSDTHLVADIHQQHHGVNTYDCLQRALAQVECLEPAPAFLIVTGDLINDDNPHSYQHLKQLTARLPIPTYFAVGNHDFRQPFRHILLGETTPSADPYYYVFEACGYRCIVLDSLVPGEVGGAIDAVQLAWLMATLATAPQQPTILFVHHPPVPTGVAWLDEHVLANSEEILDVLAPHKQVRRVFFGHVHMALQLSARGVHCTSVPSSCYQFNAQGDPKVLPGPPGYGVVLLHEARLSSRVVYF